MAITDHGIYQLGSFVAGLSPTPPNYLAIGAGSGEFLGSENYLNSEFMRKAITWTFVDNNPSGNITINSTEANGSSINEFGMGVGASAGSNLYSRDLSGIGVKNNTFDVDLNFQVIIRRG